MTTDSRTLVRRYFDDLCNGRNYGIADDLLAEDVRFFGAGVLEPVRGREGFLDFLKTLHESFPDGTFSLDDDVVEGDRAAASFTFRATHRGDYLGIPATGKRVTMKGVDLFRVSAGRIRGDPGVLRHRLSDHSARRRRPSRTLGALTPLRPRGSSHGAGTRATSST